jgi:1-hydroxycarotenoid 3,4-desaturase
VAEVVVVGAGVGGLSAALALASAGARVTVLEAAPRAGGKMGVEVIDGVEVDTGPSVLTLPRTLDGLLRAAGTSLADELELVEPEPAFRYLYPDGVALDVYPRLEATLASVEAALGARASAELAGFLAHAGRIWEAAAPHFVFGPAPGPASLLRAGPAALALLARVEPFRTLWGSVRRRVRSPHLRWLLARYATYNGSDPRRAPATLSCIAHVELSLGGYGVRGGMYEVVRALLRVLERRGVEVRTGTAAVRIERAGGRVSGVVDAAGRRWAADAVVANGEADAALGPLLGRPLPRRAPPRSTSGWTGILRAARRGDAAARVAHTVLFPASYLEEFEDMFDRGVPPRDPTVYLSAQEACHGRTGWADAEPVFLMANAPAEPADGPRPDAAWEGLREAVLARLDAAGLRAPGDALVWERTPAGLASRFPGSRGALYGAASNSPLSAFRRPANRVHGVPGLYLASGSAHPGGGVPLCVLSGRRAAAELLADAGGAA